jgi:hypothetical protein
VWYGGVMVYNYNFTMPAPSEPLNYSAVIPAQVIYYNETVSPKFSKKAYSLAKTDALNYTWILNEEGRIAHPIVRFISAPAWSGRYSIKVQLVTWVINLDTFTLSKVGAGLIPGLNVTLVRNDTLKWTQQVFMDPIVGTTYTPAQIYANLTQKTWYSKTTVRSYAWSAVDGGDGSTDGKVSIPVAVWMPQADVRPSGIKFGSDITRIYVLAGQAYGTPGVPDTPELMSTDVGTLYGYLVGPYNMTWSEIDPATYPNGRIINEVISWYDASVDPDKYELFVSLSPDWYKFYDGKWVGPFRGLVKTDTTWRLAKWIGAGWNLTLWSGAAKLVNTTAMEGICIAVVRA